MKPLTERMEQVLRVLAKYIDTLDPPTAKDIAFRVMIYSDSSRSVMPALRALQARGLVCEITAFDPSRYVITRTGRDVAATIPTAAQRFRAGEGVPLTDFLIDGAFPRLKR